MEYISGVVSWFESASGLANFFGIAVPVTGVVIALLKWISSKKATRMSLPEVVEKISKSPNKIDAKALGRVAFVDDEISDFPITELKKAGYQISTYKQVSLSDVAILATYDVIFLDIKGIVKDDPEEGGLKLLSSLRKLNPNQKICAVSNKQYDVLATKFFEQADDVAKKPMTAQKCSDLIDQFFIEKFSVDRIEQVMVAESNALDKAKRNEYLDSLGVLVENQDDPRKALKLDSAVFPKLFEATVDLVRIYRHVA
ncbi:hypothetical protein [Pseudomonas entomophila]|uniref:Uncharacterized protein n=2 Tax=Pseudomonas entomophila TaxID=312306 RepID=Q1ICJ9_PSEE4|nr:hypothetical protein [Pseudomonas entomophila]WMW04583.1 hypothetical protein RAH46_19880 [Pseudomonas entomophila]CAK14614.1 hypothetical protein PSEEN1770 [Pseudomonas entomophila L48]